jgi:hypothetical protein
VEYMPVLITSGKFSSGQLKAAIRDAQRKLLMDLGKYVHSKATIYPPPSGGNYKRTLTLGGSITVDAPVMQASGSYIEVGTNLKYARYVEEGTGLYGPKGARIYAKPGKVMAWPAIGAKGGKKGKKGKGGGMIFARSTKGMPGWHYMKKAFQHPSTEAYFKARSAAMFGELQKALDSLSGA